jgi:hypothetical protein
MSEKICVDKKVFSEILVLLASVRDLLYSVQRFGKDAQNIIPKIDDLWKRFYDSSLEDLLKRKR